MICCDVTIVMSLQESGVNLYRKVTNECSVIKWVWLV